MKKITKRALITILFFTLCLITISSANAADNSTDLGNLISNASDGSTLHLDGTYKNNVTNINIDKNITLIGKNKKTTVIDAQNSGRIFYIQNNATLTLINITIINTHFSSSNNGSAIYNNGGRLTLNDLEFRNNYMDGYNPSSGGLIYNTGDNLLIINTDFINNTGSGYYGAYGGVIYNSGNNMKVINSSFIDNKVFIVGGGYSGSGGAIYNVGNNMVIENCNFTNNNATNGGHGGAIYNSGNGMNITNCNFNSNSAIDLYYTASGNGGAIYNTGSNCNIINSRFNNNKITNSSGGAIYNIGSNLKISKSSFNNNNAFSNGGAIYNRGTMSVNNSNFTKNTARNGGAIYNSVSAILNVTSSSFMNNSGTNNGGAIYNDGNLNASYNLFYNNKDVNNKTIINSNSNAYADYNFWGTNDVSNVSTGLTINNFYKILLTNTTSAQYYLDKIKFSYQLVNNVTSDSIGVENLPAFNITLFYNNKLIKEFDGRYNTEFNLTLNNLSNIFDAYYYGEIISSKQINADKTPTKLDLNVTGKNKVGNTLKLTSKLSYNPGIAGEKIIFYLNGEKIGEAITNSNGEATLYYKIPNAGVYNFSAEYKGNEYFSMNNVNASTLYVVDNGSSKDQTYIQTEVKGDKIIATLYDKNTGKVIVGEKLYLMKNGKILGFGITNKNGQVIFTYSGNKVNLEVVFGGSDRYYPSSATVKVNNNNNTHNKSKSNSNNSAQKINANMEKTGLPFIPAILVLISILGMITTRRQK